MRVNLAYIKGAVVVGWLVEEMGRWGLAPGTRKGQLNWKLALFTLNRSWDSGPTKFLFQLSVLCNFSVCLLGGLLVLLCTFTWLHGARRLTQKEVRLSWDH